ncbi:MAG: hypothetical protein KBD66_01250 [Candidatus Doudnabacteria bacterium]|nr:hypothetical protein [Candidatus Doudnabacteria bacterium]
MFLLKGHKKRVLLFGAALIGMTAGVVRLPVDALAEGQHIQLSQYYALPGQTITVRGAQFAAAERVGVVLAGQYQTVTVHDTGEFTTGYFSVPYGIGEQDVRVEARGERSGNASAVLRVGTWYPVVSPSEWYVRPGGMVQFQGEAFAPGEFVSVRRSGIVMEKVTANAGGQISTSSFMVPYTPAEVLEYEFMGEQSGTRTLVRVTVAGDSAYLVLDAYYRAHGEPITVEAFAFGVGEQVQLTIQGRLWGEVVADSMGVARFTAPVPSSVSVGAAEIRAVGAQTGLTAVTQFTVAP